MYFPLHLLNQATWLQQILLTSKCCNILYGEQNKLKVDPSIMWTFNEQWNHTSYNNDPNRPA
ncbi:hypothetical protein Hanom_Chr03g00239151 [Helianthus anomalus]